MKVALVRGERDAYCSVCSNGLTVGVRASAPPVPLHHLFCRQCAIAIGRVGSAIGLRKAQVRS